MKHFCTSLLAIALLTCGFQAGANTNWFASEVISYSGLGVSPYDDPAAVLGKPTTYFKDPGAQGAIWHASMVVSAWNLDPNGNKIITTINPGGWIIVKFATPIEDHPDNWYGLDFIVYGNSAFNITSEEYIEPDTDMEECIIAEGGAGRWEPSIVSVAQYPNGPWYDYSLPEDPKADDFAPLQAFAWDNINHTWGAELDFTKPLDPSLTREDFGGLTVAQAIDLYKGSAGGAGFDISRFPLPVNEHGRKWIQYIKVTGNRGEVDGFSRVGRAIAPSSVQEAKLVADGVPVILPLVTVSAGVEDLGDCCYVQAIDKPCGIKLKDRFLVRGSKVTVYGVAGTDGDERIIRVTAIENHGSDNVRPLGMSNRSIGGGHLTNPATQLIAQKGVSGGAGLNTIGLLVRTWGKAKSINETQRTFVVDDGSGCPIKCKAPADPEFVFPSEDDYARVTGICSCEQDEPDRIIPVIRLRDAQDLN